MKRFLFDIVREASCVHDFQGKYFCSVEEPRDMAEMVSYDLACSEKDKCMGSEIQVRDALGALVCAFPVRAAEAYSTDFGSAPH